jgi:hypothetical protein
MPASDPDIISVDGSLDWSGGVDSVKVTTIASEQIPNGLMRNQLAWMNNATVRDGGITQRFGWLFLAAMHPGGALYQGGFMYQPDAGFPYMIHGIGGHIYRQDMTTGALTEISGPTTLHPADATMFHFVQAEQYLIIQAGDNVTLPLFWDNTTLRRSIGIPPVPPPPGTPGVSEIPAATAMCYYMDRLWYAQGRKYSAGDIVYGPSGTALNEFRDAVLNVTENPLAAGGDGFVIPRTDGDIRALRYSATLDTNLGQGKLFVFTRKAIYALTVPVTRTAWLTADKNNMPLQTVAQLVNGGVGDRCVVAANGDLFFQSLEPSIRSLMQAVRNFQEWGNVEISANEQRLLQFNDRGLMSFSSGIVFNNRLLQAMLPEQTPYGVIHKGIVPMDFIPISSFKSQRSPNWEGVWEGLDIFQLFVGDFGGRERAFAVTLDKDDSSIALWEITNYSRVEESDSRVNWVIEFPAFNWQHPFDMKKLVSGELWVDRLHGTVDFTIEYRPDGEMCWQPWHIWQACSPRNSIEDTNNPIAYPLVPYTECYRSTMTLPKPPEACAGCGTGRPAYLAYQIQVRLTIRGFCRIRGLLLHAQRVDRKLYANLQC